MEQSQSQTRRPRCPICGSRRFRRDRGTGEISCDEGHLQTQTGQETSHVEPREGARSYARRLRGKRKVRQERPERESQSLTQRFTDYTGSRAQFLQFQCFQLLLRKQIAALREVFGFPDELEMIARDLWACYVSILKMDPAPLSARDAEQASASQMTDLRPTEDLVNKLRNLGDVQDSSDEESDRSEPAIMLSGLKGKRHEVIDADIRPEQHFKPVFLLVICYLSLITLRYPIMFNDLLQWIQEGRLPWLQAIDDMPEDMRRFIDPGEAHIGIAYGLDIRKLPVIVDWQSREGRPLVQSKGLAVYTTRFIMMYNEKFGISFPAINMAPLLWRCVKSFGLPPMIYQRANKLLALLDFDPARTPFVKGTALSPASRVLPPELYAICAVVICVRLLWGTEDEERPPFDASDPLAGLFRRQDLLDAIDGMQHLEVEQNFSSSWSLPVQHLKDEQIDAYLDYLQSSLPQAFRPAKHRRTIERVFPLPPLPPRTHKEPSEAVDGLVEALYARAEPPAIRCMTRALTQKGEPRKLAPKLTLPYTLFSNNDDDGDLPAIYEKLVDRAVHVVGIDRDVLVKVLSRMEHSLLSLTKTKAGKREEEEA